MGPITCLPVAPTMLCYSRSGLPATLVGLVTSITLSTPSSRIAATSMTIPTCNDLFSRFEQQILFLEKQAEATDPTTDRHGHDRPSQGLVSKHLEKLKIGY